MTDAIVVLVTASSAEEGERIAAVLVGERLAACVNLIGPMRSIYRWEEKVQRDAEILLIVKTARHRFNALEQRVRDLHSYDVPEVIALSVEQGALPYLDWIAGAVADRD
jgi:periplasmic divalent cation tolerance protein